MTFENEFIKKGHGYALDVVSGKIVVCKWIRLNCERYLKDLKRIKDKDYPWRFDESKARRVINFIQLFEHVNIFHGNIKLEPWQLFFVMSIFGWVSKKTGFRRYRKVFLNIPRKQGKTLLVLCIALYMLTMDGEKGAEIYIAASAKHHSRAIQETARKVILKDPEFMEEFDIEAEKETITSHVSNSFIKNTLFKVKEGGSPHLAIVDEIQQHKDNSAVRGLETGMGVRPQPLLLIVGTAGDSIASYAYDLTQSAKSQLQNPQDDDRTLNVIYTIDENDDWRTLDAFKKANPNYGVAITEDFAKASLKDALASNINENSYKSRNLNVWTQARNGFFSMEHFGKCIDKNLNLQDFKEKSCYVGLDLAQTDDLCALSLVFEDENTKPVVFSKFYLPSATVRKNQYYEKWEHEKHLTVTDGDATDYDVIFDDILEIARNYHIKELGFDTAMSGSLIPRLQKERINCVNVPMKAMRISEPMKHIHWLHLQKDKIAFENNPILFWNFSNVVSRELNGTHYPKKNTDAEKIDGAVATIIAFERYLSNAAKEEKEPTDYSSYLENMVI